MTSDNTPHGVGESADSTSDNTQRRSARPRRGRQPSPLPARFAEIHAQYESALQQATMLEAGTRRAYASRVRQYLIWLDTADAEGDPLSDPGSRDGAVRDYRAYLQTVTARRPTTINTVLAAISDFYIRRGIGAPDVRRLDLPQLAPRALSERDIKGNKYREVPVHEHARLRGDLTTWIDDERPRWSGSSDTPALILNHRGTRLSARGAHNVLAAIAEDAHIDDEFTSHALRHTFGTSLVRQGHDIVIVAELMGHARLDQTRRYSLPTQADRERAINSLPVDR